MTGVEAERLRAIVEPVVVQAGFDLEGLTVTSAGSRRQVRIVVDSDRGVDLDAVAAISRAVSEQLDARDSAADPMGSVPYTLEVSSPGIGSPLTLPRHFRRAAGRLLSVQPKEGPKQTWRVLSAADDAVTFLQGPASTKTVELAYDEIAKATVEVEFNSPPPAVRELLATVGADRTAEQPVPELDDSDTDDTDTDDDTDDEAEAADDIDEVDDLDETEDEG